MTFKTRRQRYLAMLVLLLPVGASVAVVAVSRAQTPPGCGDISAPIVESTQFTPFETRRGLSIDPPINPLGILPAVVPTGLQVPALDGVPLTWATGSESGAVYQYFLPTSIDPRLTVSNFFAAGGIQLDADPIDPAAGPFTPGLAARLGERAVAVDVGNYGGVLVWADPLVNGVRAHHLYWSDDAYNYSLIANVGAENLVALGRSLVCGGFGA